MKILRSITIILLLVSIPLAAQTATPPKVLIVTAHPDDESGCAATIYKITHDLKGTVDLAVLTNGEAGFKYSTLAESIYNLELTDEKVGRQYLPTIRKQELMNAGQVVGIRNFFFFDQKDTHYTLDVDTVLNMVWDVTYIRKRIGELITKEGYTYVFTMLPTDSTHGHHKGACILALQSLTALQLPNKPIILGFSTSRNSDSTTRAFTSYKPFPVTAVNPDAPVFSFNRNTSFGFRNALNYKIIVNWLIAEHKSQGSLQMGMSLGDSEDFYYFNVNPADKLSQVTSLFDQLKIVPYPVKTYR